MVDFSKVEFLKSCPSLKDGPEKKLPEVLFVGKSNVGKSSLINALCGRKNLAYTSSKPGFTKLLNYFVIDKKFYLVDAPGYGYTNSGSRHLSDFGKMMEDYFQNPHLQLVVFLVDSRHGFSKDDLDFYAFLNSSQIPFVLAVTKGDKLNQKDRANLRKKMHLDAPGVSYIEVSSLKKDAIEELRGLIASNLKL
jgi:GTP-binding protein